MRGSPQQPNPERAGASIPTMIIFDPLEKEDPDPQVPLWQESLPSQAGSSHIGRRTRKEGT